VEVRWRPERPFDLARLKQDLFTWRGGVRYGGADVVATGVVEAREDGPQVGRIHSAAGRLSLRLDVGQAERYELRPGRGAALPAPGTRVRLVGEAAPPPRGRPGAPAGLVITVREYEILSGSRP
jgi:hypothetical protein